MDEQQPKILRIEPHESPLLRAIEEGYFQPMTEEDAIEFHHWYEEDLAPMELPQPETVVQIFALTLEAQRILDEVHEEMQGDSDSVT